MQKLHEKKNIFNHNYIYNYNYTYNFNHIYDKPVNTCFIYIVFIFFLKKNKFTNKFRYPNLWYKCTDLDPSGRKDLLELDPNLHPCEKYCYWSGPLRNLTVSSGTSRGSGSSAPYSSTAFPTVIFQEPMQRIPGPIPGIEGQGPGRIAHENWILQVFCYVVKGTYIHYLRKTRNIFIWKFANFSKDLAVDEPETFGFSHTFSKCWVVMNHDIDR